VPIGQARIWFPDGRTHVVPLLEEPKRGAELRALGVRQQFAAEQNIECWFGRPIATGEWAAVEWWAAWTEGGRELTYAGMTLLRFDDEGQVVEHRDYDNHVERREPPYGGWSTR
jgi:hypothetical protein